jgi:hypothetical protein
VRRAKGRLVPGKRNNGGTAGERFLDGTTGLGRVTDPLPSTPGRDEGGDIKHKPMAALLGAHA